MPYNPKSLNNLKPIYKGDKRPSIPHRTLVDKMQKYVLGLEDGAQPWEILGGISQDTTIPETERIKAASKLGDWAIKDTSAGVEINAQQVIVDDVESRIRDMLKTQEELDAEQEAEDALENETDE